MQTATALARTRNHPGSRARQLNLIPAIPSPEVAERVAEESTDETRTDEAKAPEVWTCTNPECTHGADGAPTTGGPEFFGWRNVPLIAKGRVIGRKPARQPQCKECRRASSKRTRVREKRSVAARRGWMRRRTRERRQERKQEQQELALTGKRGKTSRAKPVARERIAAKKR